MRNLDLTALRSFAAVADHGGVTRAARMLNLTQSAVSMQLKRLEETLNVPLLERAGRGVALTATGEQLLSYARRMIGLNDEVYALLTADALEGEITLGVPEDILYPVVPRAMQDFAVRFPRMRLQLVTHPTVKLLDMYDKGELDLILTTQEERRAETLTEAPLRWYGAPGGNAWRQRPLPYAQTRNCAFRGTVIRALDASEIAWFQVIESESDRSIEAAVSADLGVVALIEGHAPPQLAEIEAGGALPDLGTTKINLYAERAVEAPAAALAELLRAGFAAL